MKEKILHHKNDPIPMKNLKRILLIEKSDINLYLMVSETIHSLKMQLSLKMVLKLKPIIKFILMKRHLLKEQTNIYQFKRNKI
jgi:hypothetical protein